MQAAESDELVRLKWDEWEESITELTLDEVTFPLHIRRVFVLKFLQETLESSVPSSTGAITTHSTPQGKQTRHYAHGLRVKLEELDTLRRDRNQIVHRAQALGSADNIQQRVMKSSSGFERLAEVTPDMFEDILDEELAKFDKFLIELEDLEKKQNDIIEDIQVNSTQSDGKMISDLIYFSKEKKSAIFRLSKRGSCGKRARNRTAIT